MSRILRALEKVGLVEVEAQAAAPAEPVYVPLPETAAGPSEPAPAPLPAGPIQEQQPLDQLYAAAQIATSPFPAEKLLKILDGLAALDPPSRKAAVMALDAADEAWTIDDALLDAERKVKALNGAKRQLEAHAQAAAEEAKTAIAAREQRQQEAVAHIRQQIAELEGLLEREVTRATEEKASLQEGARGAQDACTRECARFDTEVTRLRRLAEIFAPAPAAPRK